MKVIEVTKGIRNGTCSKMNLKAVLGGEKLDEIFDQRTQEALFDNIINNGKIHNMIQSGSGLDTLEGLLNHQVNSNLSDFYMINPDYILQLPPEQQRNMADSISGGRQDLSLALQNLWSRGIRTEACTTKSSDYIPMLQLSVKENEIISQDIIQQLYEQIDISGIAFYDYQARDFHINLEGNNLYNYLQGQDIPISQTAKNSIFEEALKDSLQFAEEMYESYSQNGIDTSELEQQILSERRCLQEISNRNRMKQSKFFKFFSQIRSRFSRQNQSRNTQRKKRNIQHNKSKYNQQQSHVYETQTKENNPWELKPEEKTRMQKEIAEIAKKRGELEEEQKQHPTQTSQQSEYQQQTGYQNNPNQIQQQE